MTATAALESGLVKPSTEFPVETHAVIDGVELENANGESCGGSFRNSFAHSCNSVFAPLGLRIRAEALVDAAERFGWNEPATIPGEVPSTLPPAAEIDTPLEVASTAIGQFETLATPLQMASVAQTIAMRGVRHPPTLSPVRSPRGIARDLAARGAHDRLDDGRRGGLRHRHGGRAPRRAAWPARPAPPSSRTRATRRPARRGRRTRRTPTPGSPPTRPRSGRGSPWRVMLVRAGAGGATAAPAARVVLDTAL